MELKQSKLKWLKILWKNIALSVVAVSLFTAGTITYENVTNSNIVYADENTNKGEVKISSRNTAESSKTGYIIESATYPNTGYSSMNGTAGSSADLYYGISSKTATSGKLSAHLLSRSGAVATVAGINPTANSDGLLKGVKKSGQRTLYKGSDGFYYTKKGDNKQAYYAWTANFYENGAITNEKVTYFVKVMTTKKNGSPSKNLKAKVVSYSDQGSATVATIVTSTYANVGDVPNTSTLLASIFYTYGGTDGKAIKQAKIMYSNIRRYPSPSDKIRRNSDLYKKENETVTYYGDGNNLGAYIPNQLTLSSSNTTQGNTLANMLMIYGGWGFLQVDSTATKMNATSNNSFGNVLGELWNFGSGFMQVGANIVLVLVSPILWIIALIFDKINGILNMLIEIILYSVELIGNPLAWGGLVGGQNVNAPNWLAEIFGGLREQIISNETAEKILSDVFNVFKWFVGIVTAILITVFIINLIFRKKKNIRIATTWFFRLTSWFPLVVLAMAIGGMGGNSELADQTTIEVNRNSIDMLKFMVATNGDLSKVYKDSGKIAQIVGTNSINLDDFNLSVKDIEEINQYIDNTLGSQLSEALTLQSTADTATFDVNDYIEAIKLASSLPTGEKEGIPANQLPSKLSVQWQGKNYIQATGSPMLFVDGDVSRQSANLLPNGYAWNGKAYIFTEQNGSGTETEFDDEDTTKYVGISIMSDTTNPNKNFAIPYNASYWNATSVSLERPWTYLYGADQNNNSITENPQTYYFGTNSPIINNLKNSVKNSGNLDKDTDKVDETITSKDIYSASEIISQQAKDDFKIKHYWKYANAYTLALINKYQGTNSLQNDSMQLSNQSVVFLLQSNLGETGLDYFATNTNFSQDGKGKSGSSTSFKYKRMVKPQKVDWLASQQISGAFQTFALTMLLVAFVKRIATMSVGEYIIGRYSALVKGVFQGSWSSSVYYNVLTIIWVLIAKYVPATFAVSWETLNKVSDYSSQSDNLGELGAIGVGVTTLVVAWVFTKKFKTRNGLQFSIISSVIDLIDSLRFGMQALLYGRYGLDNLIYGNVGSGVGDLFNGLTGESSGDRLSFRNTTFGGDDNDGSPTQTSETDEEKDIQYKKDENGNLLLDEQGNPIIDNPVTSDNEEDGAGHNDVEDNNGLPNGNGTRSRFDKLKKGAGKAIGGLGKLSPWMRGAGMIARATASGFNALASLTGVTNLTRSITGAGNKYMPSGLLTAGSFVRYKGGTILKKGVKNAGKRLKQTFNTKPEPKKPDGEFTKKKTTPNLGDKVKDKLKKPTDVLKKLKPTTSISATPEERMENISKPTSKTKKTSVGKSVSPSLFAKVHENAHQKRTSLSKQEKSDRLKVKPEHRKRPNGTTPSHKQKQHRKGKNKTIKYNERKVTHSKNNRRIAKRSEEI